MAYYFYVDKVLLPVAPGELKLKINNKNKMLETINHGEINIPKDAGLTDVQFEVMIPQQNYPFAYYRNGFLRASYFLGKFESLKNSKAPFQFIVTRSMPNGALLFDTNLKVTMEEYEIIEDRGEGSDLLVAIKLKQFRDYGTKTANIKFDTSRPQNQNQTPAKPKVTVKKPRDSSTSPAPKQKAKTHTVVRGDTLWAISKRYYGVSNWPNVNKIVAANKSKIKDPHWIYPGQVFTIPV